MEQFWQKLLEIGGPSSAIGIGMFFLVLKILLPMWQNQQNVTDRATRAMLLVSVISRQKTGPDRDQKEEAHSIIEECEEAMEKGKKRERGE